MIIDLEKFVAQERPHWSRLEELLDRLERDSGYRLNLKQAQDFHYLYERASADLGKLMTFASEPELRGYLESLVSRAYGEIHETREPQHRFAPLHWFLVTFPRTFRRQSGAFLLAVAITLAGCLFGGAVIAFDPDSKPVLMPFPHLLGDPSDRVAMEESREEDRMAGGKTTFSAFLMTHNTKVSIFTMACGMTWGIGTIVLLFYNGIILGAVAVDYMLAGETVFLFGWLLPHGSIEIPAILVAGQAGLVLARALIGWGRRISLRVRLRAVAGDLMTLILGVALMLVWAGMIESFFSQYHEPVIPYGVKIAFGAVELIVLGAFLGLAGRERPGESGGEAAEPV